MYPLSCLRLRSLKQLGGLLVPVLLVLLCLPVLGQELALPAKPDSLHFAVIGDSGTGQSAQYQVGELLAAYNTKFRYDLVLMLGDNIYGSKNPQDYRAKFELPYKKLLDAGVKFYAALGNHDPRDQVSYKLFNMGGERYHTLKAPKEDVRFFVLDSNYMDQVQLGWLDKELASSKSKWKICYFHHPLYSSGGRHGSDIELRKVLEPLFVKHGVSLVLSGHDHFYERVKPQKGIYYFVCGAAGQLAPGDIKRSDLTIKGFDRDNHFMLMEIDGDNLYFQTISRAGKTVDSGMLLRPAIKPEVTGAGK
ncbi:MAG TPA: metallophosphoesterase [Acidobacteriota bacterium]|jgi:predicted MPP superfamily phosphohydrolase|nr:metallophosphoesterase [Acidobacteriota bacterium]